MLTQDQIDSYSDNGYLMIENALSADQLSRLQEVTYAFIERSKQVTENNDVYDLDKGHSAAAPRLTRIKLPHQQDPAFWEVLTSDRMTSMLKLLLGSSDIRLHTSKLNTKAPGGGAAVEWHQDWSFYPHTNDDMLAIGIMLGDVDLDNGPLLVIPGSHKGPVLDHTSDGVFCGAINPDDPAFDVSQAVALTGKAGSMSVHHVRTLHGSAPNLSDRARMLLLYECGAADAWPIAGNSSAYTGIAQADFWKLFNDRMICGKQSVNPRLADVPIRMPLPPAPDSTSIFKIQQSAGAKSSFAAAG